MGIIVKPKPENPLCFFAFLYSAFISFLIILYCNSNVISLSLFVFLLAPLYSHRVYIELLSVIAVIRHLVVSVQGRKFYRELFSIINYTFK